MQRTLKEQLKRGLSTLPAPKNDYEIVVPEDEMDVDGGAPGEGDATGTYVSVEDQADIDARIETERKKQSKTTHFHLFSLRWYITCFGSRGN